MVHHRLVSLIHHHTAITGPTHPIHMDIPRDTHTKALTTTSLIAFIHTVLNELISSVIIIDFTSGHRPSLNNIRHCF